MKLGIVGSRKFNNRRMFISVMNQFKKDKIEAIVSGGAKGADTMAETWAVQNNIKVEIYPADWDAHGKSAGFIRNKDIVENSDLIIAFWDGESRGSEHSIKLAEKAGNLYQVIYYNAIKNIKR